MDYESSKANLIECLDLLKNLESSGSSDILTKKYILELAKVKGYEVLGVTDSLYIKNDEDPKAILHLNIDFRGDNIGIAYKDDSMEEYKAGRDYYLINALLVITLLINQSENNFDILITTNNIQKNNTNYSSLSGIIRSENIINLNLRQPKCIADEFSALYLSNVKIPIERFEPDFSYQSFNIRLENLIGGRAGEDIDKVRLNAIKTLIGFIRKIKAKVDLDITGFEAGDRYDAIPNSGDIYFVIRDEYESELYNIFDLLKNELIEKNLKHEPDLKVSLIKKEEEISHPLTSSSFNHLASFIELVPTGAFSYDSTNNQLISSLNLALVRSFADFMCFILLFRSLADDAMEQMIATTNTAIKIADGSIANSFEYPRWDNKDDQLADAFRSSYSDLKGEDLEVIKTQYSLDASIIFRNLNVKMISLGVEYKQGEDGKYYTKLEDLYHAASLIDSALSRL